MSDLDALAKNWYQSWEQISIDPERAHLCSQLEIDRVFQLLVAAYTQPNRYYHNLSHIEHCLTILERFDNMIENPAVVEIAAWFHDVVYDPQAANNELQSANLARELLMNLGVNSNSIDRIQQLILATKGHQLVPEDNELCLFLDADLAILGAEPAQYQGYSRSIRREYSWVPDLAYQVGRVRVLKSFLQRERIYDTDILFKELESIARSNIQQEIDFLINN